MLRRILVALTCMLLVFSFASLIHVDSLNYPILTEHAPIQICGDEDLTSQAEVEGWQGSGSEDAPIVIADLKIKSESYGIHIEEVNLYFTIKNCLIEPYEMESGPYFGILIENCDHASIEECVVVGHDIGIYLGNADNAYVYRTEIMSSGFGVFVNHSSNVWLHSLDIIVCDIGIRLNHTLYTYIDDSIFDYPVNSGIECMKDSGTLIRHNYIYGSDQGVVVAESDNWVMEETIVHSCDVGIEIIDATGGYLLRSMIMNCSIYGVKLNAFTSNFTIVECWFGPNNLQNAYDDSEGNFWCLEYEEVGNYWSDFTGDGPYLILGDGQNIDLYPLSLEDAPKWEDVVTAIENPFDDDPTVNTTSTDIFGDIPVMAFASVSVAVVLLIAFIMLRSRTS